MICQKNDSIWLKNREQFTLVSSFISCDSQTDSYQAIASHTERYIPGDTRCPEIFIMSKIQIRVPIVTLLDLGDTVRREARTSWQG